MAFRIALADVTIGAEERAAVDAVLASGWLTMGARAAELEARLGVALGAEHVLVTSSCTAALHLAYAAIGVGPGDEVICPSLTFVATANAALQCGADVVLADVRGEHDLGIDIVDVERKITRKTKAIAVVHFAGYACDMDAVGALAERHGIAVVEDAAHAPLATYRGRALGTIGDIGCFSFFANKNMTTGEGGAVVARSARHHEAMRLLRSHGMTTSTVDRHEGRSAVYDVVAAGQNYRLDEMRSALGLVQLARLPHLNARRRALTLRYHALLAKDARVVVPYRGFADSPAEPAFHLMPVLVPRGAPRDRIAAAMAARGIQTSVHYPPIHSLSHHAGSPRVQKIGLERTEEVASRELTLPLHPNLRDADVDEVCAALGESISSA